MNKHKEFIKNAYNGKLGLTMCDDWKEEILKAYPEFEEKKELNKWFKDDTNPKWLMFYSDKDYRYGFCSDGDWVYKDGRVGNPYEDSRNYLATEEEVFQALEKEAVKRGFKEDVRFIDCDGDEGFFSDNLNYESNTDSNTFGLWLGSSYHLFNKDGKWGKVIPDTITKAEAEAQLGKTIID